MRLAAEFNGSGYNTKKINDFVLNVSYSHSGGSTTYYTYDFIARILTTRTGSSDGGTVVTPFSQLDHDSLETLRERLVELGGKPPALSIGKPPLSSLSKRPLNL